MRVLERRFQNVDAGFTPGVYKHYKGGLYRALFLSRDSENRCESSVVYVSLTTGEIWHRPYARPDSDSWTDELLVANDYLHVEFVVKRFQYVGVQPLPLTETDPHDGT